MADRAIVLLREIRDTLQEIRDRIPAQFPTDIAVSGLEITPELARKILVAIRRQLRLQPGVSL